MTKYESATLRMSAIALVVSLITPALTYYWFDSNSKAYDARARFALVGVSVSDVVDSGPDDHSTLHFSIKNRGRRPAESALLSVVYPRGSRVTPTVSFDPPVPTVKAVEQESLFWTLGRPIAPGETIEIAVTGPAVAIYLYTAQGDVLPLDALQFYGFHGETHKR